MLLSIVILSLATLVIQICLLIVKRNRQSPLTNNQQNNQSSQVHQFNLLMDILCSSKKADIKGLIISENKYLGQMLRMINMEGVKDVDLSKRRSVNKDFMNCLENVKSGQPQALLWLKNYVDIDICAIIIADWEYESSIFMDMKDKIANKIQKTKRYLTRLIEENCNSFVAKWLMIVSQSIKIFLHVAASYLDLSLDAILLCNVIIVLGSTLGNYMLFSSQIAFLLLASMIIPSLITAITIAYERPLVIMAVDKWKSTAEDKTLIYLARFTIICFFSISTSNGHILK